VPSAQVAVMPDSVTFAQAATLPVAGLYALEQRGGVLGRRVLVTGASGGVGHFACQLGVQAGAHVVAWSAIREAPNSPARPERTAWSRARMQPRPGSMAPMTSLSTVSAAPCSARRSACSQRMVFASPMASRPAASSPLMRAHSSARADPFSTASTCSRSSISAPIGTASRDSAMIAAGTLHPHISRKGSWVKIGVVAQAPLDRKISGKAVLHVH
jgi:NADPH:quinone reductase